MHLIRRLVLVAISARAASAGGLTWTDRGASQIKRMNFDGTGLVTIPITGATITSPGTNIRGIALDLEGKKMFWADNGTDRILTATLDGKNAAVLASLPANTSFPADVRVGPNAQTVYFCDQQQNLIQRYSFGAGLTTVIGTDIGNQPYFLDLDFAAGKIYWSQFTGGNIHRANLDGSGFETIITGNLTPRGVCLDLPGGHIYWINRDARKVHRCPLSALPVDVSNPAVQTLYQGLDTPHGLALDLPAGKLYWADTGSNSSTGLGDDAVSRGDLDGSTPQEVLAVGVEPWDVDVDPRCATYAEWRARYFRRDAAAAITGPLADPDRDGYSNVFEYSSGRHPLRAETEPAIEQFIYQDKVSGLDHLAIRFYRRPAATDLAYYVQISEDLAGWRDSRSDSILPTTVEVSTTPEPDFLELVTTRSEAPLDSVTHIFLRLRIEKAP